MRSVPTAWLALETARQQKHAFLIHIWAVPGGRVGWTTGAWGSWTYSVGFQGSVNFTDVANYAQDWSSNSGSPITRTYVPAAIEFDAGQAFRNESTTLDPHDITLTVDPNLQPFASYVNRFWPVTFGITIYKVHRAGPASIATVDNGMSVQVPVVDVLFVGYLNADDTLELNSAGLELQINPAESGSGPQAKLTTQWDHVTKVLDRLVPRPVFSIDCPKSVYSTGNGAAVDCNADMPSNLVTDTVLQMSGIVVSGTAWGTQPNSFFAQGLFVYTATDPVSGLDFTFSLNIQGSSQRTSGGNTYGDLFLEMFPPLMAIGTVCQAYRGCDRTRATCLSAFIPAGAIAALPGTFTPGTLRVSLQLSQTFSPSTQNPVTAHVYITATQVWIVYARNNTNQIGNIVIGTANAGAGTPWDSVSTPVLAWTAQGSSIITSPVYPLANASAVGPPAQAGYHVTISNNGATASIVQSPTAANGYVTIVKCPGGSAGTFDFTVNWIANSGTPVTIGNLQNFGGTDIPIEHPSLETAN